LGRHLVIVELEEDWEKAKEEKQKRTRRRERVNFVKDIGLEIILVI